MNNQTNITGFLKITALSGIFLFPVENAMVTIISEEGVESDVVTTVYTNQGGSTGPIQLEAYDEDYNLPSGFVLPVKTYTVVVSKQGYANVVQEKVPVFPNIVSEKLVYMIPLPESISKNPTIYDNTVYQSDNFSFGGEDN